MIERARIDEWLDRYRRAWTTDDKDDVARLFSDDVRYCTAPYRDPIVGRDAVVDWWLKLRESDIPWTFAPEVLAQEGELFVVRGVTTYPEGTEGAEGREVFHNLWLVTFGGGDRVGEFVEYWVLAE
jgi:SnoaL-like domain